MDFSNLDRTVDKDPIIEHIAFGRELYLLTSSIAGAFYGKGTYVSPEIVNVRTEENKHLFTKVVFHLNTPIQKEGEEVHAVSLGTFGQNDLIRLWTLVSCAKDMSKPLNNWIRDIHNNNNTYHLSIEDVFLRMIETAFSINPFENTNTEGIEAAVKWKKPNYDLLNEIERRIIDKVPMNYQNLAYVFNLKRDEIPIEANKYIAVMDIARREVLNGINHFMALKSNSGVKEIYIDLIKAISEVNFNFEGRGVNDRVGNQVKDINIEDVIRSLNPDISLFISTNPLVNLTIIILQRFFLKANDDITIFCHYKGLKYNNLLRKLMEETLITRIYSKLKDSNPELVTMSMYEFADEVNQQRLNNSDSSLRAYVKQNISLSSLANLYTK